MFFFNVVIDLESSHDIYWGKYHNLIFIIATLANKLQIKTIYQIGFFCILISKKQGFNFLNIGLDTGMLNSVFWLINI